MCATNYVNDFPQTTRETTHTKKAEPVYNSTEANWLLMVSCRVIIWFHLDECNYTKLLGVMEFCIYSTFFLPTEKMKILIGSSKSSFLNCSSKSCVIILKS